MLVIPTVNEKTLAALDNLVDNEDVRIKTSMEDES